LDETLPEFAQACLEYVDDKASFLYQSNLARIQLMSKQNTEAITTYVNLMEMDPKWLPAYIEAGHAYLNLK